MKFYHEVILDSIKSSKENIISKEKELKNLPEQSLILFEIGEFIETQINQYSYFCGAKMIYLYMHKPLPTVDQYEELISGIEEIAESYGYSLNESTSTEKYYRFVKGEEYLTVNIEPSECKMIPTGKLIPETKPDCQFFTV